MYYNFQDTDAYMGLLLGIGVGSLIVFFVIGVLVSKLGKKNSKRLLKKRPPKNKPSFLLKLFRSLFALACFVSWLVLIYITTNYVGYIFFGVQKERSLNKQYDKIVKETIIKLHSNFNEMDSKTSSSQNTNGIIILSEDNIDYPENKRGVILESYLMVILPDYLKPNSDAIPKLIILISAQSEKVATIIGYNSGEIYSSSYIFKIFDFKNGRLYKTLQSPSIRDKKVLSKFPIDFYKQVLLEAQNILKL